jgi:hypothetical protein
VPKKPNENDDMHLSAEDKARLRRRPMFRVGE